VHRNCRTSHFRREAAGLERLRRCRLPTIVVDVSRCRCSFRFRHECTDPAPGSLHAVLTGAETALALLAAAAAGALVAWFVLKRRHGPPPGRAPESSATTGIDDAEFGTLVSHDLRAPIRVVEGFTRIVKEDYAKVLDRIGVDHLDRVLGAAARMNHMIDALLALSRLTSQPIAHVPVDLSQLAGYVVEDLRRLSPERQVEVEIEPGLAATCDPTLLRMVLENLLGNAWKYTGNTRAARVAFVRHPSEPSTFTVRDNGAGFDMRFADRLFGAFQRLHSASEFPGTGVGLASVRRIVRRHGGEIRAEGEPEHGASFHFSLPGA
jgi:light-regulated signal transduction histidine kinase (bacteriophytochrome)